MKVWLTRTNYQYGVVVCRRTSLTDEQHIEFSKKFGELDDVKPYIAAGRTHRLNHDELFDVSNVEADGTILDPDSARGQSNRVSRIMLWKPQLTYFVPYHLG